MVGQTGEMVARVPLTLILTVGLVGAACSPATSDDAGVTTSSVVDSEASTQTLPTPSTPADTTVSPTEPATAPTNESPPVASTAPTPVGPLIEDVMLDIADFRLLSDYQRGILPPYDDPAPDDTDPIPVEQRDPTTTPCSYSWTRNDLTNDGLFSFFQTRACEYADQAASDRWATVRVEEMGSLEAFSDEFIDTEAIDVDEWTGRRGLTAPYDDGTTFQIVQLFRQVGLRTFEVLIRQRSPINDAMDSATELVKLQDDRLEELGISDDLAGPGFLDVADRVGIDDVMLPWATAVELVGEEAIETSTRFDSDLDMLAADGIFGSSYRHLNFEQGTVTLRVISYPNEIDAYDDLVRYIDAGSGGLVSPIADVPGAYGSSRDDTRLASLWFGARRYDIEIRGELVGDADGLLAERLAAAMADHLATVGLVTSPPEPSTVPIPDGLDTDLTPAALFDSLPEGWVVTSVKPTVDPLTGVVMMWLNADATVNGLGSVRAIRAELAIGLDADTYLDRFLPDVAALNPGVWLQQVDEFAYYDLGQEKDVTDYETYFVRHDGSVGIAIWPTNTSELTYEDAAEPTGRFDAEMDALLAVGQSLAANWSVDTVDSVDLVSRALRLVERNAAASDEVSLGNDFFLTDRYATLGAPNQYSPPDAIGDWYRTIDVPVGAEPGAAGASLRVTLFATDGAARAHLDTMLAGDIETLSGVSAGGIVLRGDGGTFATVRGRWYFELTNQVAGRDAASFQPSPLSPLDVLRRVAVSWNERIIGSGLG